MFKIRFQTTVYRPDRQVTIRNNVDGWEHDIPGIYQDDEWQFELEESRYLVVWSSNSSSNAPIG